MKDTSRGEYLPPHGVNTVHPSHRRVRRTPNNRLRGRTAEVSRFKVNSALRVGPSILRCTNCTPILFPTPVLPERQPQPDHPTHSSLLWLIPLSLMYAYYRASNQQFP